jgi:probable HAF family extracellular repeat protein
MKYAFSLLLLLASVAASAQSYTIVDLGSIDGSIDPTAATFATAINNQGQITGAAVPYSGAQAHVFLWANGNMTDLSFAGEGTALNANGDVVGYDPGAAGSVLAFLYSNGSFTDLPAFGSTYNSAQGINVNKWVAGLSQRASDGWVHGFLYDGTFTDLGTLGGHYSNAMAINDAGQITGGSTTGAKDSFGRSDVYAHAYIWATGSMLDIGTLDPLSDSTLGTAINKSGQVAGSSWLSSTTEQPHAFFYANGAMTDLGTLGGRHSYGLGLNSTGQVVGQAELSDDQSEDAFVWDSVNGMRDLNALIPANSGWRLLEFAFGINDAGQIVGQGYLVGSSHQHSFLLTPIPPYSAGIQPPINADGSSVFNASRGVVPVKFTLTLSGSATCSLPAATIQVIQTAGSSTGIVNEAVYELASDSGSNFRISACQYVYNLSASGLGVGTYEVDILINGVSVGKAVFSLQ